MEAYKRIIKEGNGKIYQDELVKRLAEELDILYRSYMKK